MKIKPILTFLFCLFSLSVLSQELHLYGGNGHDEYLGCLTCSEFDSDSVWNEYGKYGNSFNSNSIWNEYGKYGNEYNTNSPWNEYSSDPPVVVDKRGNFYGYFTLNKYKSKRAEFELAMTIYKYYEFIRDDVGEWYDKIF